MDAMLAANDARLDQLNDTVRELVDRLALREPPRSQPSETPEPTAGTPETELDDSEWDTLDIGGIGAVDPEPVSDAGSAASPDERASEPDRPEAARPGSDAGGSIEPASLVANILIGIGNKLYLRGEGGGLSRDKGQPLEFVEIGRFQWTASVPGEPVRCQLYLNDEVPAAGAPIDIAPGDSIEVTPDFKRPR